MQNYFLYYLIRQKLLQMKCIGWVVVLLMMVGMRGEQMDAYDLRPIVDAQTRQLYWFYLQGAEGLYQGYVETPVRYLLVFLYRNQGGTYMSITSYHKELKEFDDTNMVRLGNGHSPRVPFTAFPYHPFILSITHLDGYPLVPFLQSNTTCYEQFDAQLRQEYWYYLRGATLVFSHHRPATLDSLYVINTYTNIVGTFFVIGYCNDSQSDVRTFVRVAMGANQTQLVQPVDYIEQEQPLTFAP